jgi:DNA-binding NtrC family response regulator
VRELQNICERAVVLSGLSPTPGVVTRELISPWLGTGVPTAVSMIGSGAVPRFVQPGTPTPSVVTGIDASSGTGAGENVMVEPKAGTEMRPLEEIEREAILTALARFDGHRQKTAKALKIGVRTLGLKLKKWKQDGIVPMSA